MTASQFQNDLDEYQARALVTAKYSDNVRVLLVGGTSIAVYPFMKLGGEAGEVLDKLGKVIRDDDAIMSATVRVALLYELGDVLWYVAACAKELGYELSHVARTNLVKLEDRAQRGVLAGSGDSR